MDPDADPVNVAPHHTPDFYINEEGMRLGTRALASLAVDYMLMHSNDWTVSNSPRRGPANSIGRAMQRHLPNGVRRYGLSANRES